MPRFLVPAAPLFGIAAHAILVARLPLDGNGTAAPGPPQSAQPAGRRWVLMEGAPAVQAPTAGGAPPGDGGEPAIEALQELWVDKVGPGMPQFTIRSVDFQYPLPRFNYMFPTGEEWEAQTHELGILEPFISYHYLQDLRDCCKGGQGHILDFGARYGWYSMLGASMGCSSDAFEPVPWSYALMEYNAQVLNGAALSARIQLHPGVVLGNATGSGASTLAVPVGGRKVLAARPDTGGGPAMVTPADCNATSGYVCVQVKQERLDDYLQQDGAAPKGAGPDRHRLGLAARSAGGRRGRTCAMRVAARGLHAEAVAGAFQYLRVNLPHVVILEIALALKQAFTNSTSETLEMFNEFVALNYEPHLVTFEASRSYSWNIVTQGMKSNMYRGHFTQLLSDCGSYCIVYMKRPS